MSPDWPIDRDVECTKCRYNLRTLAVTSRCLECGFPVLRSFIGHEAGVVRGGLVDAERVTDTAMRVLASLLGRNRDAIGFVLLANQNAARKAVPDVPRFIPRRVHVSAAELCRELASVVLEHFGNLEDALDTMKFWRIERSEDVGRIVAGLVEAGLIMPGENDSPADFVNACVFEEILRRR